VVLITLRAEFRRFSAWVNEDINMKKMDKSKKARQDMSKDENSSKVKIGTNGNSIILGPLAADEFLDCTGLYCPVPIFETRKKIDSIKEGQILKLVADDPASEEDISHWSKTTGNELLKIEKNGDKFIFYIKKAKQL